MIVDWTQRTREELLRRRGTSRAWAYRPGRSLSVEATALGCLGLMACWDDSPSASETEAVEDAANWMVTMQQADGSLAATTELPTPGWTTPHAILLWNALNLHDDARRRAATWLLRHHGEKIAVEDAGRSVLGHDPTLVGWAWVEGTHSWLEPTALSILALSREGFANHARVAEGIRLIHDRALTHGGWNYGNKAVFGRELRPQPGPTGLALLALAARKDQAHSRTVSQAIDYLQETLPSLRAPISLGWGGLGLRAWQACPTQADDWLSRSSSLQLEQSDAATGLGLLLLARGAGTSLLIGSQNPVDRKSSPQPKAGRLPAPNKGGRRT